jgi:hypothetical protein
MVIQEDDGGTKKQIKKKVKQVDDTIGEDIKAEIEAWWLEVLQTAQELSLPMDTGSLRDSIRIEDASFVQSSFMVTGDVGEEIANKIIVAGDYVHFNRHGQPSAEYAEAVHEGHPTRGGKGLVEGRFFLDIALMLHEAELMEILSRVVEKKIEEPDC